MTLNTMQETNNRQPLWITELQQFVRQAEDEMRPRRRLGLVGQGHPSILQLMGGGTETPTNSPAPRVA